MPNVTVTVKVDSRINWQVARSDNGHWIAACQPLGLAMEGEDFEDLLENIAHGVGLLMTDLVESGELHAFMTRHGWQVAIPPHVPVADMQFDVPIPLHVIPTRGSARKLLQQAA